MKLEFNFKNVNSVGTKNPICRIELNGSSLWQGDVQSKLSLEAISEHDNILRIFFENKHGRDTVLDENNKIKQDLNFELERLCIDGLDLKHLIWESKYVAGENTIPSCLFFGPKGYWEIQFEYPILRWILKKNHDKNNNDPEWETDYKYYEEACRKLEKIR